MQVFSDHELYAGRKHHHNLDPSIRHGTSENGRSRQVLALAQNREKDNSLSKQKLRFLPKNTRSKRPKSDSCSDMFRDFIGHSIESRDALSHHKRAFEDQLQRALRSRESRNNLCDLSPDSEPRAQDNLKPATSAMNGDSTKSNRKQISELFRQFEQEGKLAPSLKRRLESASLTSEDKKQLMIEQIEYMNTQATSNQHFRQLICKIFDLN